MVHYGSQCGHKLHFNLPKWWSDAVDTENIVPITFQTFAVMVLSSLVGWKAGLGAGVLYVIEVAAGAPFGAQQDGGYRVLIYSNGGYFAGFIVAFFQIGYMAEKGWDRTVK